MTETTEFVPQPMQGQGYYNRHSQGQRAASRMALPLLQRVMDVVPMPPPGSMFVAADYGSSQGGNSLEPMGVVVDGVRRRMTERVPIGVYHADLPSNDFSALFELLGTAPESYLRRSDHVYAYAIGHSFYDTLFPPETVSVGWSSAALHWLSTSPAAIENGIWPHGAAPAVEEAFARQAAADWRRFLEMRLYELRSGGCLVAQSAQSDEAGICGVEGLVVSLNDELRDMVAKGALEADEWNRMQIICWFRNEREWREPFTSDFPFRLDEYHAQPLPWPYWEEFQQSGDAAVLADSCTGFVRGWAAPSLASALRATRPQAERDGLIDQIFAGLQRRIQENPSVADCRWTVVTLSMTRRA